MRHTRIILRSQPKTRPWRGSEQTLESGQDLPSASRAGISKAILQPSFPGLLPAKPSHPSHGCWFYRLEIAPGALTLCGQTVFCSQSGATQRHQLPLVGLVWFSALETIQDYP